MGATKTKRSNPLAEQFSYPNANAYGGYLASTPQYVAG
jgi:dimethylaniline monooxygenase (N-oxide forming)